MRRSLGFGLTLLAALTGCPEGPKSTTVPPAPVPQGAATAPIPVPSGAPSNPTATPPSLGFEEPGPLDPQYDSIKVGEVYVVKMDYGTPSTSRTEIKAKDDETVTVTTVLERAGAAPAVPSDNVLRRRRSLLERKAATLPSDEKVLRRETLTISGIAFDCKVTESDDPLAGKLTSWKCESRYPVLVKQVDASGKTVDELTEVQPPK